MKGVSSLKHLRSYKHRFGHCVDGVGLLLTLGFGYNGLPQTELSIIELGDFNKINFMLKLQ